MARALYRINRPIRPVRYTPMVGLYLGWDRRLWSTGMLQLE